MSHLGVILKECLRSERGARTLQGLLTEQMDAVDGGQRRRLSLKERLRFPGMGCCGATWVFRPATLTVRQEQEGPATGGTTTPAQQHQQPQETDSGQDPNPSVQDCVSPGMNLAAALAAERQFRGSQEPEESSGGESGGGRDLDVVGSGAVTGTPWRVSLMRLLEETDGGDAEVLEADKGGGGGAVGNYWVCCVCMGRNKGAAFIPCGHTFCRVCSRELWLNRGTCPLCNRSILEILDIF